MRKRATGGYVVVDWPALEAKLSARGIHEAELVGRENGVAPMTLRRMREQLPVQRKSLRTVLARIGQDDVQRFVLAIAEDGMAPRPAWQQHGFHEWAPVERPGPFRTTSNGLQYRVVKLRHRLLETLGRGKSYDLTQFADAMRPKIQGWLLRHPLVCRVMEPHGAFPRNEEVGFAGEDLFWVVDRWEEGRTLHEELEGGPLAPDRLRRTMTELAQALHLLHGQGIIRRELTPDSILLRAADDRVLLTDLELAKISLGRPTVSSGWRPSPYLALEIRSAKIDETVDLFSWGQVFLHAATGRVPSSEGRTITGEPATLTPQLQGWSAEMSVPRPVAEIVRACVATRYTLRPKSFSEILPVLQAWE